VGHAPGVEIVPSSEFRVLSAEKDLGPVPAPQRLPSFMNTPVGHMSADEFRRAGHEVVEWIASYWERLQRTDAALPVLSRVAPGEVAAGLPRVAPERGEAWETIFADFERVVMPGITHWQSPGFFAFFPANASGPAVLGEMLAAGLGVNGMLWATSPAATEVETRVLDWMGRAVGLPETFLSESANGGGVIQGTASEAVLVGMLAARARRKGPNAQRAKGPNGGGSKEQGRMVVYASTQAHSSVVKGAMIAGIADGPEDRGGVRLIGTDASFAMDAAELERAIEEDEAAGRVPLFVCATVGTTSSTAIDPVRRIGEVAARHGVWMHVDAALAGSACICPEFRHWLDGIELVDTFSFNPHKWLLTNFDCSLLWTRDRASLTGALSITPEYLKNAASQAGSVIDYRDWQIPLGRRFRALKLWFVVRHYGLEGLRAYIREHIRLAALFESWVRADERFEEVTERTMTLVCFRLRGEGDARDRRNKALLARANAGGRVYLTHTVLPGVGYVLRLAVGSTFTREADVRGAWEVIRSGTDAIC
jgi:aromatic-L-amino-acid decarboxylase